MSDLDGQVYCYEEIEDIANYLQKKINVKPKIGIICGSGLGSMGEAVKDAIKIDYKDIPNFPVSTVPGHKGKLIFGYISEVPVVCMQGRFHYYEGYPLSKCVMPVKLMKMLGATHLIASNAAGGLNKDLKIGDIMLIKDHVNLMGFAGNNPERGWKDPRFGKRFESMNKAYDPALIKEVQQIAKKLGMEQNIKVGVYTCMGGPNYETVAELRALKTLGIDAVGMSTVHEVITARYLGMTCLAFSLITNECVTEYETDEEPNSEEVIDVGRQREGDLKRLMEDVVASVGKK